MSRLQINFAPPGQARSPFRVGLGCALLVLILGVSWLLISETGADVAVAQPSLPAEEEILAINVATNDLNFPWLDVLGVIEQSLDDSARLVQLDLDARDRRLTLNGEARDRKAVLDLPGRLRADPAISDARVLSQTPVTGSETGTPALFPIRFALEVSLDE